MALSNEDFRKIMMTPRAGATSDFKAPAPVAKKEKKERKREYKPREPREPRPDPMAGYRDRAAERRSGEEEAPDIASLTAEVLASRALDPEKAKADLELEREIAAHTDQAALDAAAAAATQKKKSALDFKVLAQIRAEIEQEQATKEATEKAQTKKEEVKPTVQGPQTELGRVVLRAVSESKARTEIISPSRKLLRFNVSADASVSDMPVVTILNKEDVHVDPACVGASHPRVKEAVTKVMSYLPRKDHGDKAAKKKEKDKLKGFVEPTLKLVPLILPTKPAPPAPDTEMTDAKKSKGEEEEEDNEDTNNSKLATAVKPQPVEEDDIFPSLGDYVPDLTKKAAAADAPNMSYFGGKEKLTGMEGMKLDGPKIRLKKGALKEEDLAAAEAEAEAEGDEHMDVDQGAGAEAAARARGDFIPTETFAAREGYAFKLGSFGLGLYRDKAAAAPAAAAAGAALPGPAMPAEYADYPEADAYPDTDGQFQPPAPKQPTALDLAAQGQAVVAAKPITAQEAAKKGLGTVFRRDDERLRAMREKDKRERDPTFVSDNYAECYPGAFETTIEVYDDAGSDEEDLTKRDHGTGAAARKIALKRWDFKTDEEWAAYNAKREANPKAAYQFGVKMADGRKTRKDKDKDKPKSKKDYDAKLNADLQKVNALMKKRTGDGKYEPSKRAKMPELDS